MVKEEYISIELGKEAYKKGFRYYPSLLDKWLRSSQIRVPQSLLQKWLRDTHGIHILIGNSKGDKYFSSIHDKTKFTHRKDNTRGKSFGENFNSYETALEVSLLDALNTL